MQKYIFDWSPAGCDYQLRLILVGESTVGKTSLIRSQDHIFCKPGLWQFVALSDQNIRKLRSYQPPGLWQEKTLTLAEKPQLASTFLPGSSMWEVARWQDPWNLFEIFLNPYWNILDVLLKYSCLDHPCERLYGGKILEIIFFSIKWNSVNILSLLGILNILISYFV